MHLPAVVILEFQIHQDNQIYPGQSDNCLLNQLLTLRLNQHLTLHLIQGQDQIQD